ncbi:unnamed protein product [Cochlearia groenlandica]
MKYSQPSYTKSCEEVVSEGVPLSVGVFLYNTLKVERADATLSKRHCMMGLRTILKIKNCNQLEKFRKNTKSHKLNQGEGDNIPSRAGSKRFVGKNTIHAWLDDP